MRRRRALPLAALALALATAGCGTEDEPAPPQAQPDAVTIDMKDVKYTPQNTTVGVGEKVVWTNSDPFAHTVTKSTGPGKPFDSGTVAGGKTYTLTFAEPGKVAYFCEIHPNQIGSITVE